MTMHTCTHARLKCILLSITSCTAVTILPVSFETNDHQTSIIAEPDQKFDNRILVLKFAKKRVPGKYQGFKKMSKTKLKMFNFTLTTLEA